jgi:hypothetical protein
MCWAACSHPINLSLLRRCTLVAERLAGLCVRTQNRKSLSYQRCDETQSAGIRPHGIHGIRRPALLLEYIDRLGRPAAQARAFGDVRVHPPNMHDVPRRWRAPLPPEQQTRHAGWREACRQVQEEGSPASVKQRRLKQRRLTQRMTLTLQTKQHVRQHEHSAVPVELTKKAKVEFWAKSEGGGGDLKQISGLEWPKVIRPYLNSLNVYESCCMSGISPGRTHNRSDPSLGYRLWYVTEPNVPRIGYLKERLRT